MLREKTKIYMGNIDFDNLYLIDKLQALKIFHSALTVFLFLPLFVSKTYLHYLLIYHLLMVYHWYFFNNKCILTVAQNKMEKNESDFLTVIFDKYNIDYKMFDCLIHFNLLYMFFIYQYYFLGLYNLLQIILINKYLYNNIYFPRS